MTMSLLPAALRLAEQRGVKRAGDFEHYGLRSVRPNFTSSHGFRWPFPGRYAVAPGPIDLREMRVVSPTVGNGLYVAHTWEAMASNGIPATSILLLGWNAADELARDAQKSRVRRAFVLELFSPAELLRERRDDERAYLRYADLRGADLTGSNLTGADLRDAYLRGAYLRGSDLTGADLRDAYLRDVHLTDADLRDAHFTGSDLRDANLTGAHLTDAHLTDAVLTRARLARARLTGTDLTRAHLARADLRGADLRSADLTGADLTSADLTGVVLTGAVLTDAYLQDANLRYTYLTDAQRDYAKQQGALV
jgi:uncharacterized protein YjbI with pentapeptide repeats